MILAHDSRRFAKDGAWFRVAGRYGFRLAGDSATKKRLTIKHFQRPASRGVVLSGGRVSIVSANLQERSLARPSVRKSPDAADRQARSVSLSPNRALWRHTGPGLFESRSDACCTWRLSALTLGLDRKQLHAPSNRDTIASPTDGLPESRQAVTALGSGSQTLQQAGPLVALKSSAHKVAITVPANSYQF